MTSPFTTDPADATTGGPVVPVEATEPGKGTETTGAHDDANPGAASREAAKYRTQLRAAETERDALRANIDGMRRAEINRHAANVLNDPADLWLDTEVDLGEMLDDDGLPDTEKVNAALAAVIDRHPKWQRQSVTPPPTLKPTAELRGGATPGGLQDTRRSWADVLRR